MYSVRTPQIVGLGSYVNDLGGGNQGKGNSSYSVSPRNVITLAPIAGSSNQGLSGLGCPRAGLGALDLSSLSTSLPLLAAVAGGGFLLYKLFFRGKSGSRTRALRKASYKAAAERYGILAGA